MPLSQKVTASNYYDLAPSSAQAAGDIWSGLPAHGLVGDSKIRALIITPACDLSNRKVDAVTYLPIVSIPEYFGLPGFRPDLYREVEGQLRACGMEGIIAAPEKYGLSRLEDLVTASEMIASRLGDGAGAKEMVALRRAGAGIDLLMAHHKTALDRADVTKVRTLFGEKQFDHLLRSIVTNAFRLDLHFLPADKQDPQWAGVPNHSVVLFRYAFSAPVVVFERAQDLSQADWTACLKEIGATVAGAQAFGPQRPVKHVRLKPPFLSDLLTRYVAMYVRLGSPDFTADTVQEFAAEIEGSP